MKKNFLLIALSIFLALTGHKTYAQNIYTFAGTGTTGYTGDGGYAPTATLFGPVGITTDPVGNVYFCDSRNNVIRKITSAGIITTFAGSGTAGYAGDGGPAILANLRRPAGIALDIHGNFYISDLGNNVIRKIDTAGNISTIGGNNTAGFSGDGGPATAAQLREPSGIAVDSTGVVYFSDSRNHVIRMIDGLGNISSIVGNHTAGFSGDGGAAGSAELNRPLGLARANNGTLYIADSRNSVIRVVSGGMINTFAGNTTPGYSGDGGPATAANLYAPNAVAIGHLGKIYIGDSSNTVRVVGANDTITTFAATGTPGYAGDGGLATAAKLTNADGIAVDNANNVYISTYGNNVIRRVGAPVPGITITSNTGDTICFGNMFHFTATAVADTAPHYQWQVNGANVGTDSFGYTTATLVTGDIVTCQLLDSVGGIAMAVSNNLRLDSLPRNGAIAGPPTLCIGNVANLTHLGGGPAGGTGVWMLTNPAFATLTTPPTRVTGVSAGIDTVYYIASNMCGTDSSRFVFNVVVNNIGKISGPSKICTGSTVTYTDTSLFGRWRSRPPMMGTIDSMTGAFTANMVPGPAYIVFGNPGCNVVDTIMIYNLSPVAGPTSVCIGSVNTYVDTSAGGTFSVSPTTLGTIDSITGAFTANPTSGGVVNINYGVSSVCFVSETIEVIHVSPMSGSAPASICSGGEIGFSDAPVGGTWSLSPATLGTINAAGTFVAGSTQGQVMVTYTYIPGCFAVDTVTVDSLPIVAPIAGPTKVDSIWSITLTNATTGGKWSSSNSAIAKVDSLTGVVTGMSAGVVTITYTVTNPSGCSTYETYQDTVINAAGVTMVSKNNLFQLYPNPSTGVVHIVASNISNGNITASITDVTGKVVFTKEMENLSKSGNENIDISTLSQGVYIIKLQSGDAFYCGKIELVH